MKSPAKTIAPKNENRNAAVRERILVAALAEFWARGLGGARVETIAEHAGINKRFVYEYVGNKNTL